MMKKIASMALMAGFLTTGAFANNIIIKTDPEDGMSDIFLHYIDVSKHINTGSCSYMTTTLLGDGTANPSINGTPTVLAQLNVAAQNGLSAMQHRFCQAQADNGVSFLMDQENMNNFPSQVSGLNIEFSKTFSKDSLQKLRKISIQTKENNGILFLKWLVDRSMLHTGEDNIGTYYLNSKNIDWGNAAVIAGYLVQDMINNHDTKQLNILLTAFEEDINKGWNGKMRDFSVEKIISAKPSWFSCELRDNKIRALYDIPSKKIIEGLNNERRKLKLYKELFQHKIENKTIAKGDMSTYGLKYDDRVFDVVANPSALIDNQTQINKDSTLLWIGGKTYASSPERCEQLIRADIGYKNQNFFFYDESKTKKEKLEKNLYLDPATNCQTVVNEYNFPRNEKRMQTIRGVDISKLGYIVFGDGITPKNVFIELKNENQQQAKAECFSIANNGFKIGEETFKIKKLEEVKKDEAKKLAQTSQEIFPNGIWKSNDNGTCSQVDKQTLDNIVDGLTNKKYTHWSDDLHTNAFEEDWNLDEAKPYSYLYNGRRAGTMTMTKDFFGGYTHYYSKDGIHLHWDKVKTGSGKDDWKATIYAPSKELCEAVTKDHGTLSEDDFRAKYYIEKK